MSKERASLNLHDDEDDILLVAGQGSVKPKIGIEAIEAVAKKSGFVSRQPKEEQTQTVLRKRRRSSPYHAQIGIKVRPEMKELFQDISDHLGNHDCFTFEQAILALLEKEKLSNLIEVYKKIASR